MLLLHIYFFFSSRRRHTRCLSDWSSDVCSSDLSCHAETLPLFGSSWKRIRITGKHCQEWAEKMRKEMAPTVFNHTLGILRNIFEFGIRAGARYNNPASGMIRESGTGKNPILPNNEEFHKFVAEIEGGGGGKSKHCADLVRFMAYGGVREKRRDNK